MRWGLEVNQHTGVCMNQDSRKPYRVTLKGNGVTVAYVGKGNTREEAIEDARAQARSWNAAGIKRWSLIKCEPA